MDLGTPSNSGSPPAANGEGSASGKAHTRTYQACLPCRERKVKCDMGPVDGPRQHPCKRCRREDKDCVFSKTRRKDKRNAEDDGSEHDTRDVKRGRSTTVDRVFHGIVAVPGHNPFDPYAPQTSRPTTPRGGSVSHKPLTRPSANPPPVDREAAADSMKRLQDAEVFGGHDGIGTLIDAAGHIANRPEHSRNASFASAGNTRNVSSAFGAHVLQSLEAKPISRGGHGLPTNGTTTNGQPVGPAVDNAIRAWNRLRFVRAGLFTAKEGMAYVDYFFQYLYPLTPIRIADFRHPDTHVTLLEKEPMLLVTILTITSRYMKLAGAGGEYSRPSVIHEKLWTHLRGMVERFIWAQEQFGGGFCGAGAQAAKRVDPSEGLRTLGTIESFMLLTEWHPRALHFPPGDDDAQLLVPEDPHDDPTMHQEVPLYANNTSGQRRDGWLEPCWRSDRMSWMLLSHALSLAFEVGVFDRMTEDEFRKLNHELPENMVKAYFDRKTQLKELLWIYYVQTSGRLELISSLPKDFLETLHQTAADQHIRKMVPSRVKRISQNLTENLDNIFSPATPPQDFLEAPQDPTLKFWQWIAAIMKSGNQTLFANREETREIIQSKQYERYLDVYRSLLHEWRTEFDACVTIPKHMRYILEIEYQYSRVYLHGLALQAVITRCAANSPNKRNIQLQPINQTGRSNSEGSLRSTQGLAIPPNLVQKWMEPKDLDYIRDVVDGCHKVLEVVIYSLRPDEYLKHCPVRTYFRIMSVTTILLKTFVLGNYADQMKKSLQLLDRTVVALRTCSVDDVHVGNNFADICENLSSMMNGLLVRVAANPGGATTGAASRAQSQSPMRVGSPHMAPSHANGLPSTSHPLHQLPNQQHQWANNHTNSQYNLQNMQSMPNPNIPNNMQPQQFRSDGGFMSLSNTSEYTNSFPLQDVRDYDPGTNEYSIMPPPGGFNNGFEPQFSNGSGFDGMNGNIIGGQQVSDWYTLPMDSILQHAGGEVDSTMFGPDVNGMDLLDIFNPRVD